MENKENVNISKDVFKNAKINFKGKDYVQVKDRIAAVVESDYKYCVETDYKYFPERKMWVVKATLTFPDQWQMFTWLAQEIEPETSKEHFVNYTSALENAETSAVWRAFAMAWIGVIDSIASMDEINKATNRSNTNNYWNTNTDNTPIKWFNEKDLTNEMWEKFKKCETFDDCLKIIKKEWFNKISWKMKTQVELYLK